MLHLRVGSRPGAGTDDEACILQGLNLGLLYPRFFNAYQKVKTMSRFIFLAWSVFFSLAQVRVLRAEERVKVFVSILPQAFFVEQVGGSRVEIDVLVGPGQSPATYEPTPKQMARLPRADIYFSIGVPFE